LIFANGPLAGFAGLDRRRFCEAAGGPRLQRLDRRTPRLRV
jgi:hypothetical protein